MCLVCQRLGGRSFLSHVEACDPAVHRRDGSGMAGQARGAFSRRKAKGSARLVLIATITEITVAKSKQTGSALDFPYLRVGTMCDPTQLPGKRVVLVEASRAKGRAGVALGEALPRNRRMLRGILASF